MTGPITEKIRDILVGSGPASPQRVAEAIPELAQTGGAERALLLMRLDPSLERTGTGLWAARGTAFTDAYRMRESAEKYFAGRPGVPLASAVRGVTSDTGLAEDRVRELLAAQYVIVGTNIFNRRR